MEILEKQIYARYQEILNFKVQPYNSKNSLVEPTSFDTLIEKYDVFCFDGYGTLYNRGSFVYPHALENFKKLRQQNKIIRLITNAASGVDSTLALEAKNRGFDFLASETISSGSLLKDLVKNLPINIENSIKKSAFYIGRDSGKQVLEEAGLHAVDFNDMTLKDEKISQPIVAISSAKETNESYDFALNLLKQKDAILLVLNSDPWAPKIDGSREPVSGALCERLRVDAKCKANNFNGPTTFYLGKPFAPIFEKVKATFSKNLRVLMIGDTLGTDILGAKVAGFDSALCVGRNQSFNTLKEDEEFLGIRPDYYLF